MPWTLYPIYCILVLNTSCHMMFFMTIFHTCHFKHSLLLWTLPFASCWAELLLLGFSQTYSATSAVAACPPVPHPLPPLSVTWIHPLVISGASSSNVPHGLLRFTVELFCFNERNVPLIWTCLKHLLFLFTCNSLRSEHISWLNCLCGSNKIGVMMTMKWPKCAGLKHNCTIIWSMYFN